MDRISRPRRLADIRFRPDLALINRQLPDPGSCCPLDR
jgi:hypothetical protein